MKKMMTLASVAMLSGMFVAPSALAQSVDAKYVDMIGEMAVAAIASQQCDGVSINQANFNAYGAELRAKAKADGKSDDDINKMMSALETDPQLLTQSLMKFGEKHSVMPTDVAGFCGAVAKEKSSGSAIGKMVQ